MRQRLHDFWKVINLHNFVCILHFFLSSFKQRSQHYEFILKVPSSYIKRTELSLCGDRSYPWDFVPPDVGLPTLKPLAFFCSLNSPQQLRDILLESRIFIFGHPHVAPALLCSAAGLAHCNSLLWSMLWCENNKYSCAVFFSSIKIEIQQTAWGTPEMEANLIYMSFLKCLSRNSTWCLCLVPGSLVQGVSVGASIDSCGPE